MSIRICVDMHVESGHNFVVDILCMFVSSMGSKYFIVLVQTKASLLMVFLKKNDGISKLSLPLYQCIWAISSWAELSILFILILTQIVCVHCTAIQNTNKDKNRKQVTNRATKRMRNPNMVPSIAIPHNIDDHKLCPMNNRWWLHLNPFLTTTLSCLCFSFVYHCHLLRQ